MQVIDSHCHLDMCDLEPYNGSLDALISAAEQAGVAQMLTIGVDLESSAGAIKIAQQHKNVSASVGVHPHDASSSIVSTDALIKLANDPKVKAIGETGLDYYYNKDGHENQIESFRRHIQAAKQLNLPLVIHTRSAQEDTLRVMRECAANNGVMHCFTESWAMAEQALELGFYISISGIVTFKNSGNVAEIAKKVPLERLLIETDAPYLAPVPYRGQKNEPKYVLEVCKYIAKLRDLDCHTLAEITFKNTVKLFNLNAS